ncbi:HAMP domain-containing histidine kinase [Clostridium sp. LY3-2]|uniref:HAMP domain-containing sensor histidine kinase n=1 Tax=Clostridium sp. LY3-2 TaxID=2942482 RepID=UPI0021529EA5|nr:HAMP domain-containing sensor histidine kinase [Clostridium sp. LY3-2]MCR6515690.1 HAMP domain-containing histidine kinase [Clostridium sp. LY3-2]
MYLKRMLNNFSIKKKVFIISTVFVVITSLVIYSLLYLLFPKIYLSNKESIINSSLEDTLKTLKEDSNIDYRYALNEFSYNNGSQVFVFNDKNDLEYTTVKDLNKPFFREGNKVPPQNKDIRGSRSEIKIKKRIYIKSIDEYREIISITPLGYKKDIDDVMTIILPIMLVLTIIIGSIITYIYSKTISNPLLKINSVCKAIAKKDFSKKLDFQGIDEFAELSKSINLISENLKENILKLEKANKKLKLDIEKEKLQDRRRRDFLRAISHELKTPITIINGQIEGMIYNIGKYKDRDKYLNQTLKSVNKLKKLTSEIIEVSKVEEEVKVNKELVNIKDMVLDIVSSREYLINKSKKHLDISIDEEAVVYIDRSILEKVLSNIIGNSIKYSKENIKIFMEENILTIENDIFKELEVETDKLYEAFYRVEESRNSESGGSGLGLYIVKTFLELHGDIKYKLQIKDNKFIFKLEFL